MTDRQAVHKLAASTCDQRTPPPKTIPTSDNSHLDNYLSDNSPHKKIWNCGWELTKLGIVWMDIVPRTFSRCELFRGWGWEGAVYEWSHHSLRAQRHF